MRIQASSAEFKINEDLNFGLFGIPRPKRDANGKFLLSIEDISEDKLTTPLKFEEIDALNTWKEDREDIKSLHNSYAYTTNDKFGTKWVVIPLSGGANMYSTK